MNQSDIDYQNDQRNRMRVNGLIARNLGYKIDVRYVQERYGKYRYTVTYPKHELEAYGDNRRFTGVADTEEEAREDAKRLLPDWSTAMYHTWILLHMHPCGINLTSYTNLMPREASLSICEDWLILYQP